jgi:hypothetical protein
MTMMRTKPLLLLELNEVNFHVAERYVRRSPSRFPALSRLLAQARVTTSAEAAYDQLEPWIQWVSVHTGQGFDSHRVFRLGDITKCPSEQVFEKLESCGFVVGCISPMNAENRLKAPAFFIPDPWTDTTTDGSWWSRRLHQAVSQMVNDNAKARVTPASLVTLLLALARFARPANYGTYWRLITGSRRAPWNKALVLDLLLSDIYLHRVAQTKPDFSCLFLNAGAHIQHHYFFNSVEGGRQGGPSNPGWYIGSKHDPIRDMLVAYERILANLFARVGTEMIVATGLSQRPYDRMKYYWRLRDHATFLGRLGVRFKAVQTLMTRDFVVECETAQEVEEARQRLAEVKVSGTGRLLFEELEPRGNSLFATLSYPEEVTEETMAEAPGVAPFALKPQVVFVALKNGMHDGEGFAFFTPEVARHAPQAGEHVRGLHHSILSYFNVAA